MKLEPRLLPGVEFLTGLEGEMKFRRGLQPP